MHDNVTKQKGSWEKTNAGIALMKVQGVKYRVANVLMKGIELGERNTDLYTLDIKRDVVRMSGRANTSLLDEDLLRLRCITEDTFQYGISRASVIRNVSGHNCFMTKIYIAADMKVYPCVMDRRFCHGNLEKNHLSEILRVDVRKLTKDEILICKDCEFRYACFDCRSNSIEDDFFAKPWYCTYDPYTGNWCDVKDIMKKVDSANDCSIMYY